MDTRNTKQRKLTLDYLKSVKTHPTAEMIFKEIVKKEPKITLATIYRNLNLLAKQNEIIRLEINGEYRYDADMRYHQHLTCKKCGEIKDIFQKEISEYALRKIKYNKFEIDSVKIIFDGYCNQCIKEK